MLVEYKCTHSYPGYNIRPHALFIDVLGPEHFNCRSTEYFFPHNLKLIGDGQFHVRSHMLCYPDYQMFRLYADRAPWGAVC
jgi:hypothetical protein